MIPGRQYTPEVLFEVAKRRWLAVIPALLVAAVTVAVVYRMPNRYSSDTLIVVVPQRVPESYVRATVTTKIEDRLQSISQEILSRTRLERVILDFNLYPERRQIAPMEEVVESMRRDIYVQTVKGDAFRISFTASEPVAAMRVTNRLASLFIDESLRDREMLAEGTNQFLETQLEDARRRLMETEQKVVRYRREHDGELPTQVETNMQGLHNTEMQLQSLVDSLNRDRDRHLVLERTIVDASVVDTANVFVIPKAPRQDANQVAAGPGGATPGQSAAEQLQAAQTTLDAMLSRLKPEHPDVIRLRRTIADLEKRANAEARERLTASGTPVSNDPTLSPAEIARRNRLAESKSELESLDRQIADKSSDETRLRGVMADYQRRLEAAPGNESQLTELMRDYDTLLMSYKSLLAKKEDSQISANLERRQVGEQFKVLDPARLPERPSSPDRPRLYLVGLAVALAVGLGCAAAAEYFDRSMRSVEDVGLVFHLPVLATIPQISKRRSGFVAASVCVGIAAVGGVVLIAFRLLR